MNEEEKQALETRIASLEARIVELERCKHDGHSIGDEAMQQIAMLVKLSIASSLQAPKEQA